MSTTKTPRTDAELARVLSDFDLTNIDRREAMAAFARQLEGELDQLAKDANAVLKAEGEHGEKLVSLLAQNRELRRIIEAREADAQSLRATLENLGTLAQEAARK